MSELNRRIIIDLRSRTDDTVISIDSTQNGIGISEGSLNLSEILCDSGFEIGVCNASKFEAQIFGAPYDFTGWWISVFSTYEENRQMQMGEYIFRGIVDSCKTDVTGTYRDIVAYDYSYTIRDMTITNEAWLRIVLNLNLRTYTIRDIIERLCITAGFRTSTNTLDLTGLPTNIYVTTSADIVENDPAHTLLMPEHGTLKFGELLRMLCEICVCIPHINRAGKLIFIKPTVPLDPAYSPYPGVSGGGINLTDVYAKNDAEFEVYETARIKGVAVEDSETKTRRIVSEFANVNEADNFYIIKDNLFLRTASDALIANIFGDSQVISLWTYLKYTPVTMPLIVSDLSLQVGDFCFADAPDVYNPETPVVRYAFWIWSQTLSGPILIDQTLECRAKGQYLNEDCTLYIDGTVPPMPSFVDEYANFLVISPNDSGYDAFYTSDNEAFQVKIYDLGGT